ncbi:hypothetical protein BDP27DRAFT_1402281 [Rhodocollybia butyracea]|uniref:Uncharacterized protein n=1 Tax=Rhodocollybia butyracea TaxID=206335 RepID=A0A9P5PVQ1_9AGAR|nr:hypothetical protein BDP27DRAFT_1402281 [Rhodocollybia butyracea]
MGQLLAQFTHFTHYTTQRLRYRSFAMLITPNVHYAGLIFAAMLVSVTVHAMPTPLPIAPRQEKKESYRVAVLGHIPDEVDQQELKELKFTELKFGTSDKKRMTLSIKGAMGKEHFPRNKVRYANDPGDPTDPDSIWTLINGMCIFVLEGFDAAPFCGPWPCVGWRLGFGQDGSGHYTSVFQLDPAVTEVHKLKRYRTLPQREDEPKFDEIFWAHLSRDEDLKQWTGLKEEIVLWDNRVNNRGTKDDEAAWRAYVERKSRPPTSQLLRELAPAQPPPAPRPQPAQLPK